MSSSLAVARGKRTTSSTYGDPATKKSRRSSNDSGDDVSPRQSSAVGASPSLGICTLEWIGAPVSPSVYSSQDKKKGKKKRQYYRSVRLRRLQAQDDEEEDHILRVGDAVLLHPVNSGWVCRIEALFEEASSSAARFRGRWFYRANDMTRLASRCQNAVEEEKVRRVLQKMSTLPQEIILSNVEEENPVVTIAKARSVSYQSPDEDVDVTDVDYICRYRMDWSNGFQSFATSELDPDNMSLQITSAEESEEESQNSSDISVDDDTNAGDSTMRRNRADDSDNASLAHVIQEGEGSTVRGAIMIGSKYQATVPPFRNNEKVVSRNPHLIFKPGCVSDEKLQAFADHLGKFHTPYLETRGLEVATQPYDPLPAERAAQFKQEGDEGAEEQLTGSKVSSASNALGVKRSNLRKECNVDEVLHVLSKHEHDTERAITAIRMETGEVTTEWSAIERDIFDDLYRRHPGNLKEIAKALAPVKTMRDIVDYNYRYKIPDTARRFQDQLREQAKTIVQMIEKKRRIGPSAMESGTDADDTIVWQETPVDTTLRSTMERRKQAKQLLKDVETLMGEKVARKIQNSIVNMKHSYDRRTRKDMLAMLKPQPDLQRRFLEFLPRMK